MNTSRVSRLVVIALFVIAVLIITEEVLRVRTSVPATMPPPAYSKDITESEATTKLTEKLTDEEMAHNYEIIRALQQQRLAVLTHGLPTWVRKHLIAFEKGEGQGEEDTTFSRSIAWGIGWYEGEKFYWFAHASTDGWIQMDMSTPINKRDIGAITVGHLVEARIAEESDTPGTATHLAINEDGMDWTEEFCLRSSVTICDTAGAFEKYLLPAANSALPTKLMFVLRGRFPY